MTNKNKFIKIEEQDELPLHMQYLTKDTKSSEKVSFSYIKKYQGNGIVGKFYKPNAIVCDIKQEFQDV
ncbi:MAG: hypothetical protein AAF149_15705 [Bacteroidota bacterium]